MPQIISGKYCLILAVLVIFPQEAQAPLPHNGPVRVEWR